MKKCLRFDFKQDLYYTYRYDPLSLNNYNFIINPSIREDYFSFGEKSDILLEKNLMT